MRITLVHITRTGATTETLTLQAQSTVAMALQKAGLTLTPELGFSVWGRRVTKDTVLEAEARLEVADALIIDPKTRRDRRALEQGDVRLLTSGRHKGKHRKLNA